MDTVNAYYLLKARKISWNHSSEKWMLPRVTQGPFIAKTGTKIARGKGFWEETKDILSMKDLLAKVKEMKNIHLLNWRVIGSKLGSFFFCCLWLLWQLLLGCWCNFSGVSLPGHKILNAAKSLSNKIQDIFFLVRYHSRHLREVFWKCVSRN